jgi:hypothetical protein
MPRFVESVGIYCTEWELTLVVAAGPARHATKGYARAGYRIVARVVAIRPALCRTAIGLTLVLGGAARTVALYDVPAPSDREAALVTQVVDFSRLGVWGDGELGWLPVHLVSLAIPQLAVLCALSDAWVRTPSAVAAVRESGPLLWLGVSLLVWVLARRVGVGPGWSMAAVCLLAVCPAAVVPAREASAQNVAALWGLLALVAVFAGPPPLLRVGGHPELWRAVKTTVSAGLAVLTAPVALAYLPALLMVAVRRSGRRTAASIGAAVTGMAVAGIAVSGIAALIAPSWGSSAWAGSDSRWAQFGWLGPEPMSALIGLAVGSLALRYSTSKPLAVAVLASALSGMALAVPTSAIVVPPSLVLLAQIAEQALAAGRHRTRRLARGTVIAVAASVLALNATASAAALPLDLTAPPASAARGWLTGNLGPAAPVVTDWRTRVALVPGTDAWTRAATPTDCAGRACGGVWWIIDPSRGSGPPPGATLVAQFGRPGRPGSVAVFTSRPQAPDPALELRSRRLAGAALSSLPRLRLTAPLAAQLRDGQLDPRACAVLGALTSEQPIRLVALPPVPGESGTGQPLRQMLIAPDEPPPETTIVALGRPIGRPEVSKSSPPTTPDAEAQLSDNYTIIAFLEAQISPFRPYSIANTPSGVLVRFSPSPPPGLLTAFLSW